MRPLRALFVANDGWSAGHVTRALAVARALERRALAHGITTERVLATTSEAHALFEDVDVRAPAIVRLPAPRRAREAGLSDDERRRLVRGAIRGLADAFQPDLLVVDTFPRGPHGELSGLVDDASRAMKRAIVRRAIPEHRSSDPTVRDGLETYDLAIVADDPVRTPTALPIPVTNVPPVTLFERREGLAREAARAELDLPMTGEVILVASGGGGDGDSAARAARIADALVRRTDGTVAIASGPLARPPTATERIRVLTRAPMQRHLAAFDAAFAAAGYNTAHELAKAGVPTALFAATRPFDDQHDRARRFAEAKLAIGLEAEHDDALGVALAALRALVPAPLAPDGADRAADTLLALVRGTL